jgi:hypothetical protein
MKITAYEVGPTHVMRPASSTREWMNEALVRNPYRCLPLSIANQWGWEILSMAAYDVTWNGGNATSDIIVKHISGPKEYLPKSHFGEGTITWHTGYVFKTEYPYGIYVSGAPNNPKPNIMPLSGVVETYWLPFTFTMNWRFTQPGTVRFSENDVICQIHPVDLEMFNNVECEIKQLSSDPEFMNDYKEWSARRSQFLANPNRGDSWQKNYMRGTHPHENEVKEEEHNTKLKVPSFKDLR